MRLLERMLRLVWRKPDFVLQSGDAPYLERWYVIPRNRQFNVYLHRFLRDDPDPVPHDHPWNSVSCVLLGGYREAYLSPVGAPRERDVRAGQVLWRPAEFAHRLFVEPGKPCWTLFLTGPTVRTWGFYCPAGWRDWLTYHKRTRRDGNIVAQGCGDGSERPPGGG